MNRTTLGQRLSDGLLPEPIVTRLYTVFIPGPYGADINGWSFVHALSGAFVGLIGRTFNEAFVLHLMWEAFQFAVGDNTFSLETLFDVTFDTLFFLVGWQMTNSN